MILPASRIGQGRSLVSVCDRDYFTGLDSWTLDNAARVSRNAASGERPYIPSHTQLEQVLPRLTQDSGTAAKETY